MKSTPAAPQTLAELRAHLAARSAAPTASSQRPVAALLDRSASPSRDQLRDLAGKLRLKPTPPDHDPGKPTQADIGDALAKMLAGEPFLEMAKKGRNALAKDVAWVLCGEFPDLDPAEVAVHCTPGIEACEALGSKMTVAKFEAQLVSAQDKPRNEERRHALMKEPWFNAFCDQFAANWCTANDAANAVAPAADDPYRWPVLDITAIFEPVPPTEYLVAALDIAPGAPTLLAGYGFSGKTLAKQSANLSIATGTNVWGAFPCRRARVLHIDYEQGASLTRRRYQRLARGAGIDARQLAGQLDLVSMPRLYIDPAKDEDEIMRRCDGYGAITVDSLLAASPGLEENDSAARRVLDMWLRVSERTGACVTVIHHARKPSQSGGGVKMALRGSSALFDAAASVLMLEAEEGEPVRVTHTKARHSGRPRAPFVLKIEDVTIGGVVDAGLRLTVADAETHKAESKARTSSESKERIREALKAAKVPPSSQAALQALTGLGTEPFRKAYAQMKADGEVSENGSTRDRRIELRAPRATPDFSKFPEGSFWGGVTPE